MPYSEAERLPALAELRQRLEGKACPDACLLELGGLGDIISSCDMSEPLSARPSDPILNEFWRIGFEWFTLPRTPAELKKLQAVKCTCSPYMRSTSEAHVMAEDQIAQAASVLGQKPALKWLLIALLEPFTEWTIRQRGNSSLRERRMDRLKNRAEWPLSLSCLLPHGPEQTTTGILGWLQVDHMLELHQLFYDCLYAYTAFCHPLTLRHVLNASIFLHDGILHFMQAKRDIFTQYPVCPSINQVMLFIDISKGLDALEELIQLLLHKTASLAQRAIFNRKGSRQLLLAYSKGTEICGYLDLFRTSFKQIPLQNTLIAHEIEKNMNPSRTIAVRSGFQVLGAEVVSTVPETMTMTQPMIPNKSMTDYMNQAQVHRMDDYWSWRQVMACLNYLEVSQRCMNLGCCKTSVACQLQRCAGCKRFHYCSRSCQKQAWGGKVPHKKICAQIAEIGGRFEIPRKEVLRWSFARKCSEPIAPITIARSILTYFMLMGNYEETSINQ